MSYFLLVLLFAISACSKQEAPLKKQAGEEYFPQSKKGSKWEYFYILTTPKGAQQGKLIIQIDEEKMNGMRYYKQTSFMSNLPEQNLRLVIAEGRMMVFTKLMSEVHPNTCWYLSQWK